MKKRLPIIIIAVLVVVFAGLGFYSHQKSKIKYNTSYVNGNTAGNLYNAGLFCEKNGTVYFANPDDDYRLYSMDTNGNHLKKLSYDRVMYINADDHMYTMYAIMKIMEPDLISSPTQETVCAELTRMEKTLKF